jgi:lysyl-tRNA synthetase class 2
MSLDELMRQRREKLAQWRSLGIEPYAYGFDATHHAAELLARGDQVSSEPGERVRVAGRVVALRGHGKAGFGHLLDGTGRIQVYFRADQLGDQFRRYELLDVGDWAGVEGALFRTRTGEITVRAERVDLLAKALRPLPEKWHGLRDPETRFRQRYVDLFMNLEVREVFRKRARLTAALRAFLDARGFLEVETPVLQPLYGGAFARPFVTHHNALDMELFLRISNELYLKRLIVGGLDRVYEFSRDFRNEGMDRSHNPEFTMLEFYQALADVHDVMEVTEALVAHAVQAACGASQFTYQGQALDFTPPWPRLSMIEALGERLGEGLRPRRGAAGAAGAQPRHRNPPRTRAGGLLDALFTELVQPRVVRPTFVIDYPREVVAARAVQARRTPAGRALRGVRRRHGDRQRVLGAERPRGAGGVRGPDGAPRRRRRRGADDGPRLRAGPGVRHAPTGGVGIGVDRLCMLVTDARSIGEVILFRSCDRRGRDDPEAEPGRRDRRRAPGQGDAAPR